MQDSGIFSRWVRRWVVPYVGLLVGPQVAYNVADTQLSRCAVAGAIAGSWAMLVLGMAKWRRIRHESELREQQE